MKNRPFIYFICCILCCSLTACSKENISSISTSNQPLDNSEHVESSINEFSEQTIAEEKYFRIYQGEDHLYYYDLKNAGNEVIKTDCTFVKPVDISMLTERVLVISFQSGTGIETRWTYYYDVETSRFSEVFYGVLDTKDSMVVFVVEKTLIIQDIFDKGVYEKRVELSNELAETIDPFVSVKFSDNMKSLEVQYVSADEGTIETLYIDL